MSQGFTSENVIMPVAAVVGVTDHGNLTGLGDDDHSQYLLSVDAGSRALFVTKWTDLTDGGSSALHTHDHGGLGGLADDDHTQYALLAGRAGGQVLIGDTAASGDLTLQSTSHTTPGTVKIVEQPTDTTERSLLIGTGGWLATLIPASLNASGSIANANVSHAAFLVDTIFTGSANNPIGSGCLPYFSPSASIANAICASYIPQIDPGAGITITEITGFDMRLDFRGTDGAVTRSRGAFIEAPSSAGLVPGTNYGIDIQNQGLSGMTDSFAINIQGQSGATNSYVFGLPADATDPTGGGGAATGRIKCLIGGATRYIPYY